MSATPDRGGNPATASRLCRTPKTIPRALAHAAEEDADGYRDDATDIALLRPTG
uniref:hypothetical protein n=1 Tax=Streptomyces sp. F12 TaxID=1436084 RepID=UPI0015E848D7|nr:hypothetical protein [Streptomyces sp. F12]